MRILVVVDDVAEEWATLELADGTRVDWPLAALPEAVRPGRVLWMEIGLDPEEEDRRRAEAARLAEKARRRR